MSSKQDSLNRRIRETISGLSDEDLIAITKGSTGNYTNFARQAAQEELSSRSAMKAIQQGSSPAGHSEPGPPREGPARDKGTGCYIEIWSEKNFEGEHLRIEGPVEFKALRFSNLNWGSSISSLRVGPTAFVLMYADENFGGAMVSFGPGQDVANLGELSFNDEVDSIRLVNSLKVFDGSRVEDTKKPTQSSPKKKRAGRRNRGRQ